MTSSLFGCGYFDAPRRFWQSLFLTRFLYANRRPLRSKTLWHKKKGAPTCAGAPLRSGHCRVCARTEVVGAIPGRIAPRENSHVVSALRVLGDIEAFTFGLDVDAQADDDVDHLVEDRRTDARPHQRGADAPGLRDHLGSEVVVRDLADRVGHDARAAEGRIHQDAGAERADDAADAVDAEHIERVVIAERVLDHGAEEQADHTNDQAEHDGAHRTGVTGRGRYRDKSRHRA